MIIWNPGTPYENFQGNAQANTNNQSWNPPGLLMRIPEFINTPTPPPEKIENRIAWLRHHISGFGVAYDSVQAVKEHEAQNRAEMLPKADQ